MSEVIRVRGTSEYEWNFGVEGLEGLLLVNAILLKIFKPGVQWQLSRDGNQLAISWNAYTKENGERK